MVRIVVDGGGIGLAALAFHYTAFGDSHMLRLCNLLSYLVIAEHSTVDPLQLNCGWSLLPTCTY